MKLYMGKVVTQEDFLKLFKEEKLKFPDILKQKERQEEIANIDNENIDGNGNGNDCVLSKDNLYLRTFASIDYYEVKNHSIPYPICLEENSDLNLGYALDIKITIPTISVIYEIESDGLEVIENEKFNKGDDNEERYIWRVKDGYYKIISILIGSDILHDQEKIYLGSGKNIYIQKVDRVVSERISQIRLFDIYIKSISHEARQYISYEMLRVFKYIFGDDGIIYNKEKEKMTIIQKLMIELINDPDYKKMYALEYLYDFVEIEDENEVIKKVISDYRSMNDIYKYKKQFMYCLLTILTDDLEQKARKRLDKEEENYEETRKQKAKEREENSVQDQSKNIQKKECNNKTNEERVDEIEEKAE